MVVTTDVQDIVHYLFLFRWLSINYKKYRVFFNFFLNFNAYYKVKLKKKTPDTINTTFHDWASINEHLEGKFHNIFISDPN
jgi:hypothetical protein